MTSYDYFCFVNWKISSRTESKFRIWVRLNSLCNIIHRTFVTSLFAFSYYVKIKFFRLFCLKFNAFLLIKSKSLADQLHEKYLFTCYYSRSDSLIVLNYLLLKMKEKMFGIKKSFIQIFLRAFDSKTEM